MFTERNIYKPITAGLCLLLSIIAIAGVVILGNQIENHSLWMILLVLIICMGGVIGGLVSIFRLLIEILEYRNKKNPSQYIQREIDINNTEQNTIIEKLEELMRERYLLYKELEKYGNI